jgi:hypothetical protein
VGDDDATATETDAYLKLQCNAEAYLTLVSMVDIWTRAGAGDVAIGHRATWSDPQCRGLEQRQAISLPVCKAWLVRSTALNTQTQRKAMARALTVLCVTAVLAMALAALAETATSAGFRVFGEDDDFEGATAHGQWILLLYY